MEACLSLSETAGFPVTTVWANRGPPGQRPHIGGTHRNQPGQRQVWAPHASCSCRRLQCLVWGPRKQWGWAVGITGPGVSAVLLPRPSFLRSDFKANTVRRQPTAIDPCLSSGMATSLLQQPLFSLCHPAAPLPAPAYPTSPRHSLHSPP